MKTFRKTVLAVAAIIGLAAGCSKENLETKFANQETKIETFVTNQMASNDTATVKYNGGTTILTIVPGEGDSLATDGVITFYYAGYVFNSASVSSSNLFTTNKEEIATAASWNTSGENQYEALTVRLSEADFVKGLKNGLPGLKAGDEAYILFSGKYGFGDKVLGTIPANSALVYHVWVESISNE
ncbi:MAG: FKBP-type peptidyl-prolyl cis-trans isomerase [Bacteroidales bacterium]|nr:FKBP-type peptidyl-prolyl cis-trans isomerase [Bacteroidales bacterium]